MATWHDITEAVAALPETEQGTAYGLRAWRIRRKLLVWERPLRAADLNALAPLVPQGDIVGLPTQSVEEREDLIALFPDAFFTTPHFDNHTAVLARLDTLPVDVLTRLIRQAWMRSAPRRLLKAFAKAAST